MKKYREKKRQIEAARDKPADIMPTPSRQLLMGQKLQRKGRAKLQKENKELKLKNAQLTRKLAAMRKFINRKKSVSTPEKKIDELLTPAISNKLHEKVKKRLIYSEMIVSHLTEKRKDVKNVSAEKKNFFHDLTTPPKLKKYGLLQEHTKALMSYRQYQRFLLKAKRTKVKGLPYSMKLTIEQFFEQDDVSRMCAGKRETKTKNKVKKQKRILVDTMKNLHKKFCPDTKSKISYSAFRRLRPFWVCFPTVDGREMCLCVIHSNMKNIANRLASQKILPSADLGQLVNLSTCRKDDKNCMYGECSTCSYNLQLTVTEDEILTDVKYFQWMNVSETVKIRGEERIIKKVEKKALQTTVKDLASIFCEKFAEFKKHHYDISHQYKAIKRLKQDLTSHEILFLIDFSENYGLKFGEEIQSMHFGGSRKHISLHTGVMYSREEDTASLIVTPFATMSENLNHSSHAIIAHMRPIFQLAKERSKSGIHYVHFLSNSPSSQYRNQFLLNFMKEELQRQFPQMKGFVWNYSISGHGKGAADGVGAVLKRTADLKVAQGCDVSDGDQLYNVLSASCAGEDILDDERELKNVTSKPFKGIMSIHQVLWNCWEGFKLAALSSYPVKWNSQLRGRKEAKDIPERKRKISQSSSDSSVDVSSGTSEGDCNEEEENQGGVKKPLIKKVGEFVAFSFNGKLYPGKITNILSDDVTISSMAERGRLWKWPEEPDIHDYPWSAVVQSIAAPQKTSTVGQ